jgi:hypothetical protein
MSIREDYTAAMTPWMTDDLRDYLEAIAAMFEEVEYLIEDTDERVGWEVLLDPDLTPVGALPFLGQFVGENLPKGISEEAAREWVKDAPNQRRGTPRSIFYAAQRRLTGERLVSIRERDGEGGADDPDQLTVVTYTAQTPDPDGTLRDLLTVVPADIVLNYTTASGQSWEDVSDNNASWADVEADFTDWTEVATTLVGTSTFWRPEPQPV